MKLGRWTQWAEVIETAVILVSAVLLIAEVRSNTQALEHQAYMDRSASFAQPYLEVEGFTDIYAKVKEVDAEHREELVAAFQERYGLTTQEAVIWVRHLDLIWRTFQADFLYGTDRAVLRGDIGYLLTFPDQQLYYSYEQELRLFHPDFSYFVRVEILGGRTVEAPALPATDAGA